MAQLDLAATQWLATLGAAALKAVVLVALSAVATTMLRRRSAALKHLIWTVGLGATIAVLVLPAALPAWRVIPIPALPIGTVHTSAVSARTEISARDIRPSDSITSSDANDSNDSPARASRSTLDTADIASARTAPASILRFFADHWPAAIIVVWLIGALAALARYVGSTYALVRICARATPLPDAAGGGLARDIAIDLGIVRPVSILSSDEVELPLAWGVVRPRVMLPGDAAEWSAERLHYVLQHELAHVKRLDACTQLVAGTASTLFWFHPLVRHAVSRMRLERERACDDYVLANGAVASEYAGDLLSLVEAYGQVGGHPAALAMARRSQFEGRLLALLDPQLDRAAVSTRHISLAIILAILVVVPAAALRGAEMPAVATPVLHPIVEPTTTDHAEPASSNVSITRTSVTPRRQPGKLSQTTDLFAGCTGPHSSHDHVNPVNGQTVWTSSAQSGDCAYMLSSHGDVTFNADITAIDRISDGGDLDITTNIRGDVTHLLARPSPRGITFDISRNGTPLDFTTEGQPWLAAFLLTLDRHTAFAIDRRLPLLLQTGGPAAVLDETDRIQTDHVRTVYLVRLINSSPLSDDAIRRSIDAAASMTSDHDKLEVLLALATAQRLGGTLRSHYLGVAATLEASHDLRRALSAIDRR